MFCWKSSRRSTQGQFYNNLRAGYGVETEPDGTSYEGQWERDKKHGEGNFPSGMQLSGHSQWVIGCEASPYLSDSLLCLFDVDLCHARFAGVIVLNNGDKYSGSWEDDEKNGYGTYTWAQAKDVDEQGAGVYAGGVYVGEWLDNKQHGKGNAR
jgi:hypothetical protein